MTYSTAGTYAVKLKATNASGSDSLTKTAFISVNAAPNAALAAFSALCSNSPTQTLAGGTPSGGTYFINGTVSTTINPSSLTAGTYSIKYRVQVGTCADSATQNITINAAPNVSTTTISPVCISTPSFTLNNGTPIGGTYSGTGISGSTFNPSVAGTGTKTMGYKVTSSNGCADSTTFSIVVNAAPTASLSAIGPYCTNSPNDTLINGSPAGGIYSGVGVSANKFSPATAMAATHVLSYKVQVGTCSDSTTINVVVNSSPSVSATAVSAVCENSPAFNLSNGSPVGGSYSGSGVSAGMFNPTTAGSGTTNISYKVTSSNGCADSAAFSILVNAKPTVSLSSVGPFCSGSSAVTLTNGTPIGGTYSGPGISGSTFDPSIAGVGTHTIKYIATNSAGCTDSTTTSISVNAAPNAALAAFSALCSNSPTQTLAGGTPSGGTYFINGTVSTTINPSSLTAGTYSIKYRVQVGTCADSATQNITINAAPNVSTTTISPVCISTPSFTLNNGTPIGGTYSGTGISGSTFNPSVAGTGTKTMGYKVTSSNGCADSTTFSIVVNAAPTASLSAIGPYCTNSPNDTLINGSPAGGIYSGVGVSANKFSPATAMAATHVLSYKVQVGTCSDSTTINVVVNSSPSVSATAVSAVCENSPAFNLSNGSPVGGSYSGSGVSAGMFNPTTAGSGTTNISYKVTSSNGCADSAAFSILVNAKPTVSLSSVGPFCSGSSAVTLTNGTPIGGTYSGPGISGSTFDPSIAGVGTHTIKYIATNSAGCTDSTTTSISVANGTSATLDPFSSVCSDTTFTLSGGKPAGGTYSGPGVSGGVFNGGVAGLGTHTIVYTATSACGTSSDSRSINVDSVPNVTVVKSVDGCTGESFQFNATGATNYSWSPVTGLSNSTIGNPSFVVTGSIGYFLTSSHNNGCSTKDTIAVRALSTPNVIANIDLSMCIGDTFQLNASGATSYTWVPSTGLNNSTIANPQGALATSITYIVSGKDTGRCVGIDTVNVGVKPKSVVTHTPISDVCLTSDTITLVGGTPAGGVYSGPGVSLGKLDPSVAGLGTHTITYSASEPGKCIGEATVTINVLLSPSVVWNVPSTICENEAPLSLTSNPGGGTYKGSGVSGSSFNPTTAGIGFHEITYTLTASGCLANEKREIEVVPGSIVDPIQGLNNVTKKGKYNYQVKPINGAGYLWFITGGIALSSANNLTTVQWGNANNGKIMLVQTNSFGCTDTTELLVNVNALSIGDEVEIGDGIVLYPNPADKTVSLKIDSKHNNEAQIRLFNNSGQQVLDKNSVTQNEEMFEIDIAELPSGLYLLQAEIGNTAYSATLVIKH